MTEEIFIAGGDWDFWEKKEVITDDSDAKTYFGKLRVYVQLQVKRWQKGQVVELPGILDYPFDESSNLPPTGPFQIKKGITLGKSNDYLNIVVCELKNKDGGVYQRRPIVSTSWYEYEQNEDGSKGERKPSIWDDFQKEEFMKLSSSDRERLGDSGKISFDNPEDDKAWVFAKWTFLPTNYTQQFAYQSYYGDITVYDNQQEMEKAEREWRAQFSDGAPQPQDYSHYPQIWQSKPEQLAKFAKKQSEAGKSYKEIAVACKLFDDDGNPVDSANGSKVNVVTLLSELLDVPEPVVTL